MQADVEKLTELARQLGGVPPSGLTGGCVPLLQDGGSVRRVLADTTEPQDLTPDLDPTRFTIKTVPARLARLKADPLAALAKGT